MAVKTLLQRPSAASSGTEWRTACSSSSAGLEWASPSPSVSPAPAASHERTWTTRGKIRVRSQNRSFSPPAAVATSFTPAQVSHAPGWPTARLSHPQRSQSPRRSVAKAGLPGPARSRSPQRGHRSPCRSAVPPLLQSRELSEAPQKVVDALRQARPSLGSQTQPKLTEAQEPLTTARAVCPPEVSTAREQPLSIAAQQSLRPGPSREPSVTRSSSRTCLPVQSQVVRRSSNGVLYPAVSNTSATVVTHQVATEAAAVVRMSSCGKPRYPVGSAAAPIARGAVEVCVQGPPPQRNPVQAQVSRAPVFSEPKACAAQGKWPNVPKPEAAPHRSSVGNSSGSAKGAPNGAAQNGSTPRSSVEAATGSQTSAPALQASSLPPPSARSVAQPPSGHSGNVTGAPKEPQGDESPTMANPEVLEELRRMEESVKMQLEVELKIPEPPILERPRPAQAPPVSPCTSRHGLEVSSPSAHRRTALPPCPRASPLPQRAPRTSAPAMVTPCYPDEEQSSAAQSERRTPAADLTERGHTPHPPRRAPQARKRSQPASFAPPAAKEATPVAKTTADVIKEAIEGNKERSAAGERSRRPSSNAMDVEEEPKGALAVLPAPTLAEAAPADPPSAASTASAVRQPSEVPLEELALSTIDRACAAQICECTSAESLAAIARAQSLTEAKPEVHRLGTWMIWMVHRVALDDPSLETLNFSYQCMPAADAEPRIAPKLMKSLEHNTHLKSLLLDCSSLHGGELAVDLGRSLARNSTLHRLDMESNHLEPEDLQVIFRGLGSNYALQELRCSNQFCEQAGREAYATLHEALTTNRKLEKLGMDLLDRHYRDQIVKALIRNTEEGRRYKQALQRRQMGGA